MEHSKEHSIENSMEHSMKPAAENHLRTVSLWYVKQCRYQIDFCWVGVSGNDNADDANNTYNY